MGWLVAGAVVFVVYAAFMFKIAVLGVAMDGARKKPATGWSLLGTWLLLLAVPLWLPVFLLISGLKDRFPR
ncbi:hypothetical protein AB0J55_04460 [Amycolatopsis sp. NPDC049688]|uniref:hypothetical protein n=1 Tax=Amycolatopsis sp. NPDC049688 TaxID=3154733 RepID=UPI00343A0D15